MMITVHIRPESMPTRAACCSHPGESISEQHYHTHVVLTKDECCRDLFARLCPSCIAFVDEKARSSCTIVHRHGEEGECLGLLHYCQTHDRTFVAYDAPRPCLSCRESK